MTQYRRNPITMVRTRTRGPSGVKLRWPLVALTAMVPFTYVPHELGIGQPPVSLIVLAGFTAYGLRFRVMSWHLASWEWFLLALTAVVTCRSLASFAEGSPPGAYATVSLLAVPLGVLVLTRVAMHLELQRSVVVGLGCALGVVLVLECYQLLIGLPALQSNGYLYPEFIYHTTSGSYRPFGSFRTPVTFGIFLAMLGLALAVSATGLRRWVTGALVVGGLAATETRSAWIGAGVALVVVGASSVKTLRASSIAKGGAVVYLAVLGAVAFPGVLSPVATRLATLLDSEYESNATREVLWRSTARAISEAPLFGHGSEPLSDYLPLALREAYSHPHNNYLQVAFSFGIIGLLPFLGYFASTLVTLNRSEGALRLGAIAATTAFLVASLFESMWTTFAVLATLGLINGVALSPLRPRDPERIGDGSPPDSRRVRVRPLRVRSAARASLHQAPDVGNEPGGVLRVGKPHASTRVRD